MNAYLLTACAIYLIAVLRAVRHVAIILFFVVSLSVLINLWDFFAPFISRIPGRAAGFYFNPTIAGTIIAMSMVPALLALPNRFRFLFALFCGLGVFVTFSKGSWIIWIAGFILCIYMDVISFKAKKSLKLLVVAVLGVVTIFLLFSGIVGQFFYVIGLEHYLTPNTMARLGIGNPFYSEEIVFRRLDYVWLSLHEWQYAPIIGHGLGSTWGWKGFDRPHNMYLLFLVEGGLLGFLLFIGLLIVLWTARSPAGTVFFAQFAISGIFSHNNLEQPAVLFLLAFFVVYNAGHTNFKKIGSL